ncbi:RuBisCO large subunit C-terminal-like domain-containing protein [Veillonella sp. AS16]|uniref:RuBisCO large subunit C-terminal-like domain-containing protein n=1 Tax=Veillonella sp. AS16 TaxID=936589 RepID=UPI0003E2549C|nr:RuBisCO large subunit C-terminal-like domain-containing protein [Veillonella sp. AS16]ETS93514.1 ribulose bisphosphate carboxylase large chain, catalytic domain protein [Veillonella sp. AS16]
MKSERFIVTYRIAANSYDDARAIARAVQVEQTIEFPYEFVTDEYIKEHITGQLVALEPMKGDSPYATVGMMPGQTMLADSYYVARISYAVETTAMEATQFLNVIFGNSSLQPHIWVVDVELCPSLYELFKGPRFGLAGIRKLVGTPKRPMIQAVIKPMGTSSAELARMCGAYTRGGADVIKDDHGISNQSFSEFRDRISRCAYTVQEINAAHGTKTLYAANISGDGPEVMERAQFAKEAGATALMVASSLIGFGWLHVLATDETLGLPIINHPAFSGCCVSPGISGVADYLQLGLFPRLFGADMPIFVSYGGRFTFTQDQCQRISRYIKNPTGPLKAACPAPGGGITDTRLAELVGLYGNDTMFLVGGDMFRRGPDIESNMAYFVNRLDELSDL